MTEHTEQGQASVATIEPQVTTNGNEQVPIGTFVDYKRVVLSVTSDLRQLRGFASDLELEECAGLINEVLERIENDTFTVAVVGEFKRGKSTFINALLGVSVLPTDVLPCSATLNRVSYALSHRVVLEFKNGRREEVPFDKLADYVTQLTNESEAVAKTIKQAIVYYPSPYCQNNVDVYDTPGLNDSNAMTDVTLSVLPRTDAAIMVILAQSPFSEYERDFLENRLLMADLGRVVFVVNGIDNFPRPEDADRVIKAIEDRIQKHVLERAKRQYGVDSPEYEAYVKKIGKPRVFGISAYQAVVGKEENDREMLERSRFSLFERELQRLLTEGRGAVTLQVPVNRILATCREILGAVDLRRQSLGLKRQEFDEAYEKSKQEIEDVRRLKEEELAKVHDACTEALKKIEPLAEAFPEQLRTAAAQALDEAEIEPNEIDDEENLKARLGKLVDNALRRENDKQATDVQFVVNDALAAEIERLSEFERTTGGLMDRINVNFGALRAERHFGGRGEVVAAAIAVATGFGGVWSGFRQANVKGALVGGAVSLGTALAAGIGLGLLSIPVSIPVVLGVCLATILPGSLVARKAFPERRVERFRATYKEAVLEALGKALEGANLRSEIQKQARTAFAALGDSVSKEVSAALADAENTLIAVRARYERESAMSDAEKEHLDEIQQATLKFSNSASRLSRQLVEIMEI